MNLEAHAILGVPMSLALLLSASLVSLVWASSPSPSPLVSPGAPIPYDQLPVPSLTPDPDREFRDFQLSTLKEAQQFCMEIQKLKSPVSFVETKYRAQRYLKSIRSRVDGFKDLASKPEIQLTPEQAWMLHQRLLESTAGILRLPRLLPWHYDQLPVWRHRPQFGPDVRKRFYPIFLAQLAQTCVGRLAAPRYSKNQVPWANPLAPSKPPSFHAVTAAGIGPNESIESRVLKTLLLLDNESYFERNHPHRSASEGPSGSALLEHHLDYAILRASYGHADHWDRLRSGDEVLEQKVGAGPWGRAYVFLAILRHTGIRSEDIRTYSHKNGSVLVHLTSGKKTWEINPSHSPFLKPKSSGKNARILAPLARKVQVLDSQQAQLDQLSEMLAERCPADPVEPVSRDCQTKDLARGKLEASVEHLTQEIHALRSTLKGKLLFELDLSDFEVSEIRSKARKQ